MSAVATVIAFVRRARGSAFTPRDRFELERWADGERRVVVHEEQAETFALLYASELPWASWGLSRVDGKVLLWDCVSLEDIGRFGSVAEALSVVAGEASAAPVCNVISFAQARDRAL